MTDKANDTIKKPQLFVEHDAMTPVYHALAMEIGLNESIMLAQLAFWIKQSNNLREGIYWTYQSIRDMKDKCFAFWSTSTINRIVTSLEEKELIYTTDKFNKRNADKTRWFALNPKGCSKLKSIRLIDGIIWPPPKPADEPSQNETPPETEDDDLSQNGTGLSHNETDLSQNGTDLSQNETTLPENPLDSPDTTQDTLSPDDAGDGVDASDVDEIDPEKQRNSDIAAIIKIHLDTGVIEKKPGASYSMRGKRDWAAAILDQGITVGQVDKYVNQHLKKQDFWKTKSIDLKRIANNIQAWIDAGEPVVQDEPDEPIPDYMIPYDPPPEDANFNHAADIARIQAMLENAMKPNSAAVDAVEEMLNASKR